MALNREAVVKKTGYFGFVFLVVAVAWGIPAHCGAQAEHFYVVKLIDVEGVRSFTVLSAEASTAMKNEITIDNRLFPKALKLASEIWKSDESGRKGAFPKSCVRKREMTVLKSFLDKAKAEEEAQRLEASESDRMARQDDDMSAIERQIDALKSNTTTDTEERRKIDASIKRLTEALAKRKGEEREKESKFADGRAVFREAFDKVKGELKAQAAAKTAAKVETETKPDAKPAEKPEQAPPVSTNKP